MNELTGKTLGRYQILERIGQGGMAEVFKGYQVALDRLVAVKVLHSFLLEEYGSLERFHREARAVATLRHSNIVQVFDFDTVDNISFMVMEFVDGPNLKMVLQEQARSGGRLSLQRIVEILTPIGDALGYAHGRAMVHRDIKPHNIMFTASGQPLLTDFGIVKLMNSVSISDPSAISGTPAYMSPEQGRGATLDTRTDIYSLGVVLYEMITGRVPFDSDTPFGVVFKHINDPLPMGPENGIPPVLEPLLLKVLAKSPDERYQTVGELVRALQAVVAEAGDIALPPQPLLARNALPAPMRPRAQGTPAVPVATPPPATPPRASGRSAAAPMAPPPRPTLPPAPPPPPPVRATTPPPARTVPVESPEPVAGPSAAGPAGPPAPVAPPAPLPVPSTPVTYPPRTKSDDSVTLRLATPTVSAETGGPPVENTAVLTNPRQEQDYEQYTFEVADLDPTWYELDTRSVLLWRGDSAQVGIKFAVPRRGAVPGVYIYRLIARSLSNAAISGYTTGRLVLSSSPTLQMAVTQLATSGQTSHYRVDLGNGAVGGTIVNLEGSDPGGILEYTITPPRVRLESNEEAQVDLEVGVRADAVGEARSYSFIIIAKVTGGDESTLPIEARAEFAYVPPVLLNIEIELDPLQGPMGDYRVVLTNPTSLVLNVDMQAGDPEGALDFYFHGETDHLQIGREEQASVKGIVRLKGGAPAEARTYPYTLRAHVANAGGPGELDLAKNGELVYSPPPPAPVVEEPDLLERVRLELVPARVEGEPARFTVRLQQEGTESVLAILRGRDPAAALEYNFEPPQIYLEPGKAAQAILTLSRNGATTAGAGAPAAYPFEVICATPGGRPDRVRTCAGEWVPPPPAAAFQAVLIPVEPSGTEGTYDVRLTNGGPTPLGVILRGRDPAGLLTFTFVPARVTLRPASEQTVRLTVRTNALEPLSEEHTYPFEVICWVPGTNRAQTLGGELLYISF